MTDPFAAMFQDIELDYEEALSRIETDAEGVRHRRDVVFARFRGFRPLTLYLSVPRRASPPPLVVFIHGGAWLFGHPEVTNPVYRRIDPIGKLLRAGFAVARISYRFSGEGRFPTQLHDCKAAVRFLRNRAALFGVDPERFAAMGDSAGGHLAALVGLTGDRADLEGDVGDTGGSSGVQAVIDWFGPAELLTMREQALPDGMQGMNAAESPESQLVGARFSSAARRRPRRRRLPMSQNPRRHSTFSTARATALCRWGRAKRCTRPWSRRAQPRRWWSSKARTIAFGAWRPTGS
jgi:acetyl esterase/lipase